MSDTPQNEEKQSGGYIGQAWLVIFLALCYGAALAGVQTTLGPIIEENKKNETYSVIPKIIPGAVKDKTEPITLTDNNGRERRVYKAVGEDGSAKGWLIPASGLGFADRIEVLVGANVDLSKITGIYVLNQKETPGLGNLIQDKPFCSQFAGKSTDKPLAVAKQDPAADNEIIALSGATISSDSVAKIVNEAIADLKEPILELSKRSPKAK